MVSDVPPASRGKVQVSVVGRWWCYDYTRLLYVPTPPVHSYCTGIYKNQRNDKRRVETITRTEDAFMTMGCVFAACWNGKFSHSLGHVQSDHHRGGNLVSLPTGSWKTLRCSACTSLSDWPGMMQCYLCRRSVVLKRSVCLVMAVTINLVLLMTSRLGRCIIFHHYVPTRAPRRV